MCNRVVAPVGEKRMILDCEETMGVAQLLRDYVQIGQSVGQSFDIRADDLNSSKVMKGSTSTLFINKLLTPKKRKLKIINSSTMICNFETNLADNPPGERMESPAKRRKCATEGSVNY